MNLIGWFWNGLPWYVQWGAIAGACLMLVGLALNLGRIVKSVSGWWGVAGLGVFMATIAAWVASNVKPNPRTDRDGLTAAERKATVPTPRRRQSVPKRKTLRDIFRRGE